MKKIFTLLFAVGLVAVAQAQPGSRDDRQFDRQFDQRNDQRIDQQTDLQLDLQFNLNDFERGYDKGKFLIENDRYFDHDRRGGGNNRFAMERRMKMRIAMINQEYDYKIQKVRRSFFLTWFEKQRQIRNLENQRRWEISMVYAKFNKLNGRNNRYGNNGHY